MRRAAALLLLLAACTGAAHGPGPPVPLPAPLGDRLPAGETARSNRSLAALFARLTFETEWGGARPGLLRYEAPVTAALEGPGAAAFAPFLRRYLAYLRRHAGLAVALGRQGANLHLRFVPGGAFRDLLPGAACTLVPGSPGWTAFRAAPARLGGEALLAQRRIRAMTIFLPADAAPHRIRGCLMEEIAQALGPVNDIAGLSDSIFNDDAAHLWPTRLDLLMLRVLHDPAMATGLPRAEAERRARRVLDRLNPAGPRARDLRRLTMPGEGRWRRLMGRASARGTDPGERLRLVRDALALARGAAPDSPWACQSESLLGRLLTTRRPGAALPVLRGALSTCAAAHGAGDIRLARLQLSVARVLLARGDAGAALSVTAPLAPVLAGHGLDAGLATLYALRARAAARLGRPETAAEAEALARGWAAYAFGPARRAPLDWY